MKFLSNSLKKKKTGPNISLNQIDSAGFKSNSFLKLHLSFIHLKKLAQVNSR